MMVRTQIQLTAEQAATLRRMSAERGTSVADLIRRSVDEFVERNREENREALIEATMAVLGRKGSGKSDVSRNHDDYYAATVLD